MNENYIDKNAHKNGKHNKITKTLKINEKYKNKNWFEMFT